MMEYSPAQLIADWPGDGVPCARCGTALTPETALITAMGAYCRGTVACRPTLDESRAYEDAARSLRAMGEGAA